MNIMLTVTFEFKFYYLYCLILAGCRIAPLASVRPPRRPSCPPPPRPWCAPNLTNIPVPVHVGRYLYPFTANYPLSRTVRFAFHFYIHTKPSLSSITVKCLSKEYVIFIATLNITTARSFYSQYD